jgi:3-hydroxyacyl-CoA dehydrogenase
MRAAVIGAGLIGRAWTIVFARGGCEVFLYDTDTKKSSAALRWARTATRAMAESGLLDNADTLLRLIHVAPSLEAALEGSDHVQENVGECLELKQAVFCDIEKSAPPGAVLASSSSALMPSLIFGELATRARCLIAHPMNPPHLAPVVELCGGDFTAPEMIEKTSRFMRLCGMVDVILQKEIDGFVLNRLQHAVLNEAFRLIEGGYVSPDDLDKTIKDGLALRWAFMGPVETIDLNAPGGVLDYMQRYGSTIRSIGDSQERAPDWTGAVVAGMNAACRARSALADHEIAQARRDHHLMALLRHKRNAGL